MTDKTPSTALDPVREHLIREAERAARSLLTAADADAAGLLEDARAQAARLLADAREQGTADGQAALASVAAVARRRRRALELGAQNGIYQRLRARVQESLAELRRSPEYPALQTALEARARAVLGPDAVMSEHPDGGLVARADGRRVDYSLPALAERALDRVMTEVEELWLP